MSVHSLHYNWSECLLLLRERHRIMSHSISFPFEFLQRCANEFRTLLSDAFTAEAVAHVSEDGKTVLNSWTMAKRILKPDPRYSKVPRKEREVLWRRYADDTLRKQKLVNDQKGEKHGSKSRATTDAGKFPSKPRIQE